MSFINNYTNPDFTIHYAEEFEEDSMQYIYAVGYVAPGQPAIVKSLKDGTVVWKQSVSLQTENLRFYKVIQLYSAKSHNMVYIVTAYDGVQLFVLSFGKDGTVTWAKNIVTRDEDIHCFLEPVVGESAFYIAYSDKNDDDTLPSPIVLKFSETGKVTGQLLLRSTEEKTGFVINTARSRVRGLVIAGRMIQKDSVGFIIDISSDLKQTNTWIIRRPFITIQDILVNGEGDYIISAYSNPDDSVIISHIGIEPEAPYHVFPRTAHHASVLTQSEKHIYLSVFSSKNGTVHMLTNTFDVLWSKILLYNDRVLGVKTLEYEKTVNSLTATTWQDSLLVSAGDAFSTCLTQEVGRPELKVEKLAVERIKLVPENPKIPVNAAKPVPAEIRMTPEIICGDDAPCVKDELLCSLYEQLKAQYERCFAILTPASFKDEQVCARDIITMILVFNKAHPEYNLDTILAVEIETIRAFINTPNSQTYNAALAAVQAILAYLYQRGDCGCGKDELDITDAAMMQSPHLYIQSAGSLGNDSTKGIHLRWLLKGGLAKHLPKANYATPGINFNKANDFVKIYRTPYTELKTTLDLGTVPDLVTDAQQTWAYNVGMEVFYVYFRNAVKYAQVRTAFDPAIDPVGFIKTYGNALLEIEHKTKLSFAVTLHFTSTGSPQPIDLELRSSEKTTITAPKRVTLRKKHTLASLSGIKQLSENIRSIRFRATNALITTIDFEFYLDFIADAKRKNAWSYLGKHALTKDTALAYSRLEPQPGVVDGDWLRFNDNAFVRIDNYKAKWNSPLLDPENRILDTVDRYITLSNNAANPEATELIYYNDPNATPIPGYEPDPDFDPTENQFELSNLYVLQLASMDYHIARMLGLGVLDLSAPVFSGSYLYLAEYVSFGDLQDGQGAREVQHFYCSLPTELASERLPLAVDLKPPVPGIFQGLGTEAPTPLTDANGYSLDGKSRFLSLFNEDLPDEPENAPFFNSAFEFVSADGTIPVFAGIEYRASTAADWQKPELPFDRDYFNIDGTVPPNQANETRAVIIPDPGYPVYVHREKHTGWHDYSSYGINWFSRATSSPVIHSIETFITPANLLLPPTNINAVLIRSESPLFLTSADEQLAYNALTSTDKTFIRLSFDYNHGQELIDYHKEINGELINGYSELPDSEELFAEDIEIFFRNEIPDSVSGKIASVTDGANALLAVVTTDVFLLPSQGNGPDDQIIPVVPPALEPNLVGSALTVNGATFIIHQVDNTGTYPKFIVFKNDADGFPVALTSTLAPGDLTSPPVDTLFVVVENMLSPASWTIPNPLLFKVHVDLDTVYNETVYVHVPDGTVNTHVQKFRGVYQPAVIEEYLEDHDGDELDGIQATDTPRQHLGIYKITFTGFHLPQHSQAAATPHRVEWYKGAIRVHTNASPNGPRKTLQVIKAENIGSTTSDLVVYAVDGSFSNDAGYDKVATGTHQVNYYPGYKTYLKEDAAYGLSEASILPGPTEDVHYSIFGLRSHDIDLGYVSKFSQPVLMYAQKIEEPMPPRVPEGGKYTTRPDFFGKSSYTFSTRYDQPGDATHKPYAVQFGRASDVQLLTAFWRNDETSDPSVWTVQRIQNVIFEQGEAPWYVERWANILGFSYTYAADPGGYGLFELLPNDPSGIRMPLPNSQKFKDSINAFIAQHNLDFQTSIPDVTAITSMYQVVIPAGPQNAELQLIDFFREAVHNCFVPLTEIPVIYQHIGDQSYEPIPKKQVIRDERGELLLPSDPRFDMAPMMKVLSTSPHQTQFTDFGIDGSSNAKYFYISREFNLQMKTSPYSPVLGPINLVNTAPPKAPEIVKITPVLENRAFNIAPAIELELNAYLRFQHIRKIIIYRATSMQDALSVRTMKRLDPIDTPPQNSATVTWKVKDDFSDLGYVPFGDPLFYVVTVLREVKYNDRDNVLVNEFQPSEPSKLTMTNIVENYNPDAPVMSYTSQPLNPQNELELVSFTWNKTVYNGKYHLYKRNEKGNWVKIAVVQTNNPVVSIALADTDLANGTLAKTDANGNTIYHAFKVVAENFAGMLSQEENILSI